MNFRDNFNRLERLKQLIHMKATGTPDDLAIKLNTSRRNVFYLLDVLRSEGKEIIYDRYKRTYKYKE